jgi:hypothetical protein
LNHFVEAQKKSYFTNFNSNFYETDFDCYHFAKYYSYLNDFLLGKTKTQKKTQAHNNLMRSEIINIVTLNYWQRCLALLFST